MLMRPSSRLSFQRTVLSHFGQRRYSEAHSIAVIRQSLCPPPHQVRAREYAHLSRTRTCTCFRGTNTNRQPIQIPSCQLLLTRYNYE